MELEAVRTLYPVRSRAAWHFAVSILFVIAGVEVGGVPSEAAAGLFGFCAFVFGVALLPGSGRLDITHDGIAVRSLFFQVAYRWSEIEQFRPRRVSRLGWVVTFDCVSDCQRRVRLRRLSRALCGYELALPDTYAIPGRELAAQLEEHRLRTRGAPRR